MAKEKRQNFLQGALILMSAAMIVKVIGYLFKVPLKGIIGVSGYGYFNAAYGLFNTLYTLSVAGLPVAVARMVAHSANQNRYRDVKRIRRISTLTFLTTGLTGSVLMLLAAGPYVRFTQNERAYPAVLIMAPAIFFICVNASFRGYYEGLRNMVPTALSQITEAMVKLACGLSFSSAAIRMGLSEYAQKGTVFGHPVAQEALQLAVLPYGAAGAILGIVVSTAACTLFLVCYSGKNGDGISRQMLQNAPEPQSNREIFRQLWQIAIPICLGGLALNITTLIDVGSLTNRLSTALERGEAVMLGMYQGVLPQDIPLSEVPNYLFGAYNLSVTLYNLVPAFTHSFGISALPTVTAAWASQDRDGLRRSIESVWRLTAIIAFPAGFGLCALAEPILTLVYRADPASIPIAAPILRVLGLAAILVAINTPTNSMLQATGRVQVPVRLMLMGGAVKLAVNFVLVPNPAINIQGAPFGTLLCYGSILCLSIPILCRTAGMKLSFKRTFFKPMFAGSLCGLSAWAGHGLLVRTLGNTLSTLCAIAVAAVVYLAVLFLTKGVEKSDVLALPKGEKIAKTLAKCGLM